MHPLPFVVFRPIDFRVDEETLSEVAQQASLARALLAPLAEPIPARNRLPGEPMVHVLVAINVNGAKTLIAEKHFVSYLPLMIVTDLTTDVLIILVSRRQERSHVIRFEGSDRSGDGRLDLSHLLALMRDI